MFIVTAAPTARKLPPLPPFDDAHTCRICAGYLIRRGRVGLHCTNCGWVPVPRIVVQLPDGSFSSMTWDEWRRAA